MFNVWGDGCWFWVSDSKESYLHSDGSILRTVEYWPTKEEAQDVLDKFHPKHEWKHGDVFRTPEEVELIYFKYPANPNRESEAISVSLNCGGPCLDLENSLSEATFLFNINDKLNEEK